jgi:hypothetical protein
LILLGEGIALHLWEPPGLGNEDASFVRSYLPIARVVCLLIAPPGIAASLGLMRSKDWARKLMAGLLWLGVACVVLFWVAIVYSILSGAPVANGRNPLAFALWSILPTLAIAGFLGSTARSLGSSEDPPDGS